MRHTISKDKVALVPPPLIGNAFSKEEGEQGECPRGSTRSSTLPLRFAVVVTVAAVPTAVAVTTAAVTASVASVLRTLSSLVPYQVRRRYRANKCLVELCMTHVPKVVLGVVLMLSSSC